MNKAYNRINWGNDETPINESNLNKMDYAIDEIDNRIVKLDKTVSQQKTLRDEVVEAAELAKASETNAKESEEKAKQYYENTSAVSGIKIATQTTAGIIKGGENYIDESGELQLTKRTDSPTLYNSYAGGIKLNELGGASEQDSTTGAQLLDLSDGKSGTNTESCMTFTNRGDGSYTRTGQAVNVWGNVWFRGGYNKVPNDSNVILTLLPNKTYFVGDCALYTADENGAIAVVDYAESANGKTTVTIDASKYPDGAKITGIRCGKVKVGATYNDIVYPRIFLGTEDLGWEPYTGEQPSPNPEYPQIIKPVTGKNLLDCRGLTEKTSNGVTFTPVYDENGNLQYINVNGTASTSAYYVVSQSNPLSKGEYILSGCPSGGSSSTFALYIDNVANDFGNGRSFNVSDDTSYKINMFVYTGYTATNLRFYPMIRPASIADPTYVPYGLLRFWGHGEDLFDGTLINGYLDSINGNISGTDSQNYKTIKYKVDIAGDYTFSFGTNVRIIRADGTVPNTDGTIFTYTWDVGWHYISFRNIAQTAWDDAVSIQLYKSQSITLSSPIKLNGVGTAQDKFVRKDGVLKIERNFVEVVFDGSDDEAWTVGSTNTEELYRLSIPIADIKKNTDADTIPNILSTHFRAVTPRNTYTNVEGISVSTSGILLIYSSAYNTSDVSLWKANLAENPITVQYEAAQPTYEDLPTADQIALNSLVSYDGITYLYCDSEVQSTWDLEYGTSRVGGYTLEAWNTAMSEKILNEARYNEIVAAMLVMNQE